MKVQIIVSDPETATFFDWSFSAKAKPTFRSFGFDDAKTLTEVIDIVTEGITTKAADLKKGILRFYETEESAQ